jgi:hypothetical protein
MSKQTKESRQCVDCGIPAPPADTSHTLISKQHGWRLTRARGAEGEVKLEWRCPACWKNYRARE